MCSTNFRSHLIIPIPPLSPQTIQQAGSKRVFNAASNKFHGNIHKRGQVDIHAKEKSKYGFAVGPVMLGFFIFVVIGSSLLQIIRTATSGAGPQSGV